jgi:hypothetical protein
MQEAFYFGPEDRELLGVYHPALGIGGNVLTVVCPPLFSEFNRTHAALRNLSLALAQKGQHVMRMEFSGTGDSCGDLRDSSIADWMNEVSLAIDEGKDLSGCRRVRILGVRGSALLVCESAGNRDDVDRIVLWDPTPDGTALRESLDREQDHLIREHLYMDGAERREVRKEFDIYRMNPSMWDEWPTLDASIYRGVPANKLRIVRTPKADDITIDGVELTNIDFIVNWEIKNGEVFMCQPVLEGLLDHLVAA